MLKYFAQHVFRQAGGRVVVVDRLVQAGDLRAACGDRSQIVAHDHQREVQLSMQPLAQLGKLPLTPFVDAHQRLVENQNLRPRRRRGP